MGRGGGRGITGTIWQLAAALYLVANGVLGLQGGGGAGAILRGGSGVFHEILHRMGFRGDTLGVMLTLLCIIAIVAGIAIVLDLFSIEVPFLNIVVLVVGIFWIIYIVITLVSWIGDGFGNFFQELSMLAVNAMILASLLTASKRFE